MFENHQRIGLDLDDTLLNGPAHEFLASYVNDNPEKEFYLVTHRTPQESQSVPSELTNIGLNINQFVRLVPTTDMMRVKFRLSQQERKRQGRPGIYTGTVSENEMNKDELNFVRWKGYVCKRLGITVLIDDGTAYVKPGTDHYGIEYIDPYDI